MLINIDKTISMILLIFIPIYIVLYIILKKPLFISNLEFKEAQNNFFSKVNEQLDHIKNIKINANFDTYGYQLKGSFNNMLGILLKFSKISYIFSSTSSFINTLSQATIFYLGGIEILRGNITLGQFTIINTYFSILLDSINYYLGVGKYYQDAKSSLFRIEELLSLSKEKNGSQDLNHIDSIILEKVNFYYEEFKIIHNFDYKFNKGNIYCLVGYNGSGKTTLINLIIGIINENYSGNIAYNLNNIEELNMYNIRSNLISFVPQEPILYNDTIINYLTDFSSIADISTLDYWVEKLYLKDKINELPHGIYSNIYANSSNLSGGEKQKLSIIKAMLKDSELVIFDEPTSALDSKSIDALKENLISQKSNKIIIIVTHDQTILDIADEIIDLGGFNKDIISFSI